MKTFELIKQQILKDIPKFSIKKKSESWVFRVVGWLLKPINEDFNDHFITTMYPSIYIPDNFNIKENWDVLAHEWVHLLKGRKYSRILYGFLYLFPVTLAPLALLSFLAFWCGNWWLLNLIWLACLLPIPLAVFRWQDELEAYTMSMACFYWEFGVIPDSYVRQIAKHFYGPNYYYMYPFKNDITNKLFENAEKIKTGHFDNTYPFYFVKEAIRLEKNSS